MAELYYTSMSPENGDLPMPEEKPHDMSQARWSTETAGTRILVANFAKEHEDPTIQAAINHGIRRLIDQTFVLYKNPQEIIKI